MINEKDLEVLGLNKNLTLLYLTILQSNGLSAAQLAAVTKLNRSNVYALAEQLVAENLVNVDFVGNKRRYTARDPEVIHQSAEKKLKAVEQLIPELKALYAGSATQPRISYYEGDISVKMVFNELLTVQSDHYCYFGSLDAQLAVEGTDNARKLVEARLKRGIKSRSIRTREADMEEPIFMAGSEFLREVRYFPKQIPAHSPDLYIYDNRLSILSTYNQPYALIIESPELATLMRAIWDMIWDISLTFAEVEAIKKGRRARPSKGGTGSKSA